jgi:propanol-preferring alcohol dehydrogenase
MKAMQLLQSKPAAQNPLVLVDTAVPQPSHHQIRIKVNTCGVCHTDLQTVEGDLATPHLPIIPGHQIVGIVDKVGPECTQYQPGDRVGVTWLNWTCGECHFCQQGLENLCPEAHFTGLHMNGGYAEFVVVDERFAFPIPANFSDAEAAPLLCAGVIGYRSLRLSGIQPGQKLGLYGFGASAHLVIQVARHWDCDVYIFTRSKEHQEHALELGAAWVGQAQDKPPVELDAGITFAPAGWLIPLALGHLRPGGTLAINSIHMSPIPEMPYNLLWGERVLRSIANVARQDAAEFLPLAAEIPNELPRCKQTGYLRTLKQSQLLGV